MTLSSGTDIATSLEKRIQEVILTFKGEIM